MMDGRKRCCFHIRNDDNKARISTFITPHQGRRRRMTMVMTTTRDSTATTTTTSRRRQLLAGTATTRATSINTTTVNTTTIQGILLSWWRRRLELAIVLCCSMMMMFQHVEAFQQAGPTTLFHTTQHLQQCQLGSGGGLLSVLLSPTSSSIGSSSMGSIHHCDDVIATTTSGSFDGSAATTTGHDVEVRIVDDETLEGQRRREQFHMKNPSASSSSSSSSSPLLLKNKIGSSGPLWSSFSSSSSFPRTTTTSTTAAVTNMLLWSPSAKTKQRFPSSSVLLPSGIGGIGTITSTRSGRGKASPAGGGVLGFAVVDSNKQQQLVGRASTRSSRSSSSSTASCGTDISTSVIEKKKKRIVRVARSNAPPPLPTLASNPTILSRSDIDSMTVVQLKACCRERGLKRTGNKLDLRQHLYQWAAIEENNDDDEVRDDVNDGAKGELDDVVVSSSATSTDTVVNTQDAGDDNPSSSPSSLQEWARTVDLKPLLERRAVIHRQKQEEKEKQQEQHQRSTGDSTKTRGSSSSLPKTIREYSNHPMTTKPATSSSRRRYYSDHQDDDVYRMYENSKHADQRGDRTLAKQLLLELRELTPNDARVIRRLSRMYSEDGDIELARTTILDGLLNVDPNNAYLWQGLAELAPTQRQAIVCYNKAIDVDPTYPNPYHALAMLHHTSGNIVDALRTLKNGALQCPTNHRIHHALGEIYVEAGMYDLAEHSYRLSLQYGPSVSRGYVFTSLAKLAYENNSDDIDICREWLYKAMNHNDGRQSGAFIALSRVEESVGNYQRARDICRRCINKYERKLIRQQQQQQQWKKSRTNREDTDNDDKCWRDASQPAAAAKIIPTYRSGDRFFQVYRNWARLEMKYGNDVSTFDALMVRATTAFPNNWKLILDWAYYHENRGAYDVARKLYAKACSTLATTKKKSSSVIEVRRKYAEMEMLMGNYHTARKILYTGAKLASSSSASPSLGLSSSNNQGSAAVAAAAATTATKGAASLAELYHTWAVCEWHLGEISRAEVLFDHALRMTDTSTSTTMSSRGGGGGGGVGVVYGSSSSSNNMNRKSRQSRASIFYSMARFEHQRGENVLAQHLIGLCLKEAGDSKSKNIVRVWRLWAKVALQMNHETLSRQCLVMAERTNKGDEEVAGLTRDDLKDEEDEDEDDDLLLSLSDGMDSSSWTRRDPWDRKIRQSDEQGRRIVKLPTQLHGSILYEEQEEDGEQVGEPVLLQMTNGNLGELAAV